MTLTERPSNFSSVHLPLVYEFANTKFPTNTTDTTRTATQANVNGYTELTLNGDIKATGNANALEYVSVVVNGTQGIYQIITWTSDTVIVIDLPYNAGNTIGNVVYYYSNYHQRFKIYAGIRSGHFINTPYSTKPYRLLAEIKAVPDSSGETKININEILKSDIEVLGTGTIYSQNDIDSFTEFYIEYAEAYDYSSDGKTLSTYVSTYNSDSTDSGATDYRIAVNSKLPFKNGYGGVMTQYIGTSQKFLTLFTNPVIFSGFTYEIWFLRQSTDTANLRARRYSGNTLLTTSTITVDDEDEGVYHVPITISGAEDRILLDLYNGSSAVSEEKEIKVNQDCYNQSLYLTWKNYLGGQDFWLFTAEKDYSIEIEETQTTEKNIFIDWASSYNGDTIRQQIKRVSRESVLVRSQNLTLDQVNAIKYIKTSPVVKIYGDRTVLVDSDSFTVYSETDKLYSISFKVTYTNDIPSQSL